ncbi:MAG: 30S ribosomal protein S17 [Candidatus Hatepunaea meridiana]|nr:30S ribosomal protein S17 [Candidatus Hatepunaea meridiana]
MEQRGNRKVRLGVVTSTKMDKTIAVKVERRIPHYRYKKYYTLSKKLLAHDPENTCNIGDKVRIVECRPISLRKKWRLMEVVERSV